MTERIKEIWSANREVYGRSRIHAELREEGKRIGAKRVGRLMREAGIEGVSRRRSAKTTTREQHAARVAPDLVDRDFSAAGTHRLWVADIERHEAPLNLAVVGGHRHRPVAAGRLKLRAA